MTDRPALLCFDGSEHAAEAIRGAGALFPGQEALVLTVATPAKDELPLDPVSDLVGRLSGLYHDWDEAIADLAERQARRGCELATAAGFRPRPFSTVGTPTATILRVADQHDAAVIVLGAGKRGPLGGLLGTVVARIVHEADRPVLVIPSPPRRR